MGSLLIKGDIMKFKLITLALLASLSTGTYAGDFEKILGGVVLGVVISNHISGSDRYYSPPPPVYVYPQPVYIPPQVVYAPPHPIYSPPQVIYAPQPDYYYEQRRYQERRHSHREWHRNWRD